MNRNKSGFGLIIAIIVMVLFAAMGLIGAAMLSTDVNMSKDSFRAKQTFFIADSGIRYYIKEQLRSDDDWSDNTAQVTKSFTGGSFTVTPLNQLKGSITLRSTGTLTEGGITFTKNVEYKIKRPGPAAFSGDYVAYGMGDIEMRRSNNAEVTGDVYTAGDVDLGGANHNGDVYDNQADAQIPSVDWTYWQNNADYVITGDYTFDQRNYSGIYYVNGNVLIDKTNQLNFNGTIIATGDIAGDNIVNAEFHPDDGRPALVSGGDVSLRISNNVVMDGPIYAANDISFDQSNSLVLNGPIVFGGTLYFDNANNPEINIWDSMITEGFIGGQSTGWNNPESSLGYGMSNFKEVD